jgi:hypothetical protein
VVPLAGCPGGDRLRGVGQCVPSRGSTGGSPGKFPQEGVTCRGYRCDPLQVFSWGFLGVST